MSIRRTSRWTPAAGALVLLTLAALLLLIGAPAAPAARPAAAEGPTKAQAAPLNPDFVLWQARRDLNAALQTVDGYGLGARPAPHALFEGSVSSSQRSAPAYPAFYDLRALGKVSSVKNQDPWGTCWTFATAGSMESCLLPGESTDFSEDNIVLTSGFDTGSTAAAKYDFGGHIWMSTAYLARWGGPVWESDDAYGDGVTPGGLSARKHLQDISFYAQRSSSTDNDRIKYAVSTSGGTYVTMSWQDDSIGFTYYNATSHAYYYNGGADLNHAVLVVGWDDAYAASNFAITPPGNGAFIVKNSWGTGFGDFGYFYVSYYDSVFARSDYAATFEGVRSPTNYDTVYQHDPLGNVTDFGTGGTTCWGANRFTASATSSLGAVGFYAEAPNTAYEIWQGPSTAALTKLTQGTLPQMGFHTVTLPSPVSLTSGAAFVVAAKLTTPGSDSPLAVEYSLADYSSAATASPGQSYYSSNGTTWTDLTTWRSSANACIKAYATTVSDTTPPVTTDNHLSVSLVAPCTITLTPTDSGSGMVGGLAKTEYKVDGAATYTVGTSVVLGAGAHTVAYRSTDAAGNLETPDKSFSVTVTAPVPAPVSSSSYAFAGGPAAGWHTGDQAVTITASGGTGTARTIHYSSDGGATWTSAVGDSVTATVTGDGPHRFQFYASDSLATEAVHDPGYVNIDSTPPVTTDDHLAVPLAAPAAFTLTPSDTLSGMIGGLAKTEYKIGGAATYTAGSSVVLGAGTHTVAYRSTDAAGNRESPDKSFTVTVVGPPPPVSSSSYAFAADGLGGWHKTAQAVSVTASGGTGTARTIHCSTDGGATWAATVNSTAILLVSDQGSHRFQFYASDSLATEVVHDPGYVNIDTVRPATRVGGKVTVKKGKTATLKYRIDDALPGCGTAVVRIQIKKGAKVVKTIAAGAKPANAALSYRFKVKLATGTYTYRVLATDLAGNMATAVGSAKLVVK
jgi:C1A family cysteine protease